MVDSLRRDNAADVTLLAAEGDLASAENAGVDTAETSEADVAVAVDVLDNKSYLVHVCRKHNGLNGVRIRALDREYVAHSVADDLHVGALKLTDDLVRNVFLRARGAEGEGKML